MKFKLRIVWVALLTGGAMGLTTAKAAVDDWPQWRGPNRDGVSKESGLLPRWPAVGPPLKWMITDIGIGYSSPAIVGKRVYILGSRGTTECAIAIDANTGKHVWSTDLGPTLQWAGNNWGDGPRATTTIAGELLFALSSNGELVCLNAADGQKRWSKNLFKDFNGHVMDNNGKDVVGWGYSEGPLVDGDRVVVSPGGEGGLLAALNIKTGETLWRSSEVVSEAPYSSIIAADIGGVRQYVQMTLQGVVGVDAKTGKRLWSYDRPTDELIVRTPIVRDNHVFITQSFDGGSELFSVNRINGSFQTEKVYANKNLKNAMGGVILLGEHLFGHSDRVGWVCQYFIKNKGGIIWEEKRKLGKGSVTCADDRLYCFTEDDGIVALLEASPAGFKEHGRFPLPQQTKHRPQAGKLWSHPVVANGNLYIRDQELLFCYDVRDSKN